MGAPVVKLGQGEGPRKHKVDLRAQGRAGSLASIFPRGKNAKRVRQGMWQAAGGEDVGAGTEAGCIGLGAGAGVIGGRSASMIGPEEAELAAWTETEMKRALARKEAEALARAEQ
ncbi:unnamed protein product, partial [Choristocarpus tenellus]